MESTQLDKKDVESTIEQNIRYLIEHSQDYTYDSIKRKIYNYDNRDKFIDTAFSKDVEKIYARAIYLKTANKVIKDYDKIYKLRKTSAPKSKKSGNIRKLGITYCVGSGIYGFLKALRK